MLKQSLILTPTQLELQILKEYLPPSMHVELSGFGSIASGIVTMRNLGRVMYGSIRQVILVGIGGTYDPEQLPVGSAWCFRNVSLWGVGADTDANFQLPSQMQLPQLTFDDGQACFETLDLKSIPGSPVAEGLLTVTSASGNQHQADMRHKRFPQCLCEDMEGFAVAMAARIEARSVTIIRGISNVAGDRNKANWKTREALLAAAELLKAGLSLENNGGPD